jgi:hypothetical protein
LGVVVGVLGWLLVAPGALLPVMGGGAALLVLLAGAVAVELARFSQPRGALGARALLVSADLLAAGCILWLFGLGSFAPALFFVPIVLGALLFSRRVAVAISALAMAGFAILCAAQAAFNSAGSLPVPVQLGTRLSWIGALAGISSLLVYWCMLVHEQAVVGFATAFRWIERLTGQRAALRAEQRRLIEATRILEDAQSRLAHERATINRQMLELARVVERLSAGDTSALHALRPGVYGPLMSLTSALTTLAQHLSSLQSQQQQTSAQQQASEALCDAAHEQGQLLMLTDNALRELSASANDLVATVQRVEHGGERFGLDWHALVQALREVEQQALNQASDTAMLGARLAQLRARQSEIESSVRHLARTSSPSSPSSRLAEAANGRVSGPQAAVRGGEVPVHAAGLGGQRLEPLYGPSGQRASRLA